MQPEHTEGYLGEKLMETTTPSAPVLTNQTESKLTISEPMDVSLNLSLRLHRKHSDPWRMKWEKEKPEETSYCSLFCWLCCCCCC